MAYFKAKNIISIYWPLQLLHIDLFGPSRTISLGGNIYTLVIVDDYSGYTWTLLLSKKKRRFCCISETKVNQKEKGLSIASIKNDHGGELQNEEFKIFYNENGIQHTFSIKWGSG